MTQVKILIKVRIIINWLYFILIETVLYFILVLEITERVPELNTKRKISLTNSTPSECIIGILININVYYYK